MVDVVDIAYALSKAVQIVNGCEYIINCNMLGNKVIAAKLHFLKKGGLVVAALFKDFRKNNEANLFINTDGFKLILGNILGHIRQGVYHAVGDNLDFNSVGVDEGA